MEEQIKARIAELKEEHARFWQIFLTSDLGRRIQAIEGAIPELEKLLPKQEDAAIASAE